MVSFTEAIRLFFTRAFDFRGRSTRAEYWWVYLFNILVSLAIYVVGIIAAGVSLSRMSPMALFGGGSLVSILSTVYGLIIFIPNLALIVRRLHDINHSGWWVLGFIAIYVVAGILVAVGASMSFSAIFRGGSNGAIGLMAVGVVMMLATAIWQLVWLVTPSYPYDNKWGQGPDSSEPYDNYYQ